MFEFVLYTLLGVIAVLLIDVLGAIASRIFKFEYGYLSFVFFGIYFLIGYFISAAEGLNLALISSLFVGFIDATVGWRLSMLCKANTIVSKEDLQKMSSAMNLKIMLFVAPAFAVIGYFLCN